MYSPSRRELLATVALAGGTAIAGCLDAASSGSPTSAESAVGESDHPSCEPARPEADGGDPVPIVDRSLPQEYEFDELLEASLDGGPGPDGIPSIDDPVFAPAGEPPENLADGDPVFGVVLDGVAKAYPQYVFVWHEIVNDVVGDESVAVTYCPLTGTAQGFYRGDATFGVSGELINSNLVMFDRETESWWPQMLAQGITDEHEGAFLGEFQVTWSTWGQWRDRHPGTVVLTEETRYVRDYGSDPYGGYNPTSGYYSPDDENTLFPPLATDDRFAPKEAVIGARTADGAAAVPKDRLREAGLLEWSMEDEPYLAVFDPALETGHVYRNPDGLELEFDDGAVVVDGDGFPPDDLPLDCELGVDAMWFAWYGYYPSTEVVE
ncbi:DUF3179 domain-containing protein [Natronobeatus ordinarius]|uniref:DUF3179 domain-containing protein n=1 Tax=Natronobeatus ordinarius TaxID=2963433 RepID=UPI0020CBD0B9|nr:DUF3179 domain-containing (seleno)protein [Natronobeatus ordinarius]